MEINLILAMAVAAVAEEKQISPSQVIVKSFKEIQPSSLKKYITENKISYHKYQLGE